MGAPVRCSSAQNPGFLSHNEGSTPLLPHSVTLFLTYSAAAALASFWVMLPGTFTRVLPSLNALPPAACIAHSPCSFKVSAVTPALLFYFIFLVVTQNWPLGTLSHSSGFTLTHPHYCGIFLCFLSTSLLSDTSGTSSDIAGLPFISFHDAKINHLS